MKIDRSIAALLDGFVKDSAAEGIQVIFVKSPVYRPLLDRFTGIPVTDTLFAAIAGKYQVPVLDYYRAPIGLDSTNFYNSSHLNKKGSDPCFVRMGYRRLLENFPPAAIVGSVTHNFSSFTHSPHGFFNTAN